MAKIDLGKINFVFRGTWAALTAYTERDVVVYTDDNILSTYACIATSEIVGDIPSVNGVLDANWVLMARGVSDSLGAIPQGAAKGALISDGAVNQSFTVGNHQIAWQDLTTTATATVGDAYMVDTSGGAFTLTLPPTPVVGDTVWIVDAKGNFATTSLTVDGNSENIHRQSATVVMNIDDISKALIYHNTADGWIITG